MLQRIRESLKERTYGKGKLGGPGGTLEADETFVGGKAGNMHGRRRKEMETKGPLMNKTIVQGIYDRNLRRVRAEVVPNVARETLQNILLKNIRYGSIVYTDNAVGYDKVKYNFVHDVVNHTHEYVRGSVHTNSIENFWALLKRTLKGTYVCVEPFHLSRYVDEQVFRFNNRKDEDRKITDAERFATAMSGLAGRRLTYSDLTGKSDSPHHANDRDGGNNGSPLLVLVVGFRLAFAGRFARLLPRFPSPSFGLLEDGYGHLLEVLHCLRPFCIFRFLHLLSLSISRKFSE